MRDYTKAIEAVQEATDHDPEHKHTREIAEQERKCQQALFSQRGEESQEETLERAMRDPEVAVRILWLSFVSCFFIPTTGYHERSSNATNLTAGARQPARAAGPHEKPRSSCKDSETGKRRDHQDWMRTHYRCLHISVPLLCQQSYNLTHFSSCAQLSWTVSFFCFVLVMAWLTTSKRKSLPPPLNITCRFTPHAFIWFIHLACHLELVDLQ
jgi:hypothetical protein